VTYEPPTPESWDPPEQPRPKASMFSARWWQEWWKRFTGFLLGSREDREDMPAVEPLEMPEGLDIHEPSDSFTLETPAMGDGFNFVVRVRCSWCVQATATKKEKAREIAKVREFIKESQEVTRERIEERIRPIARTFPPYRAAEAEELINKEIVDCLNDGKVRVTVRARVDVCEPVRQDLQKVWQRRLADDAEADANKAYAEALTVLQKAWTELLVKGLASMGAVPENSTAWLAPYALALSQDPKHAADFLRRALNERVNHTELLLRDLGLMVVDEQMEAIEFAFQSDSALRALLTLLGVPIPAKNGDHAGSGGARNA
jgi:hypothetical protein